MHRVFNLNNGIRVVTEKIDYVKSVSVGVWVYAGSAMENAGINGVSHFIEHMLFKGTENRSAKEIAECMDAVGGQLNALTAREYTCYYTKTLSEHLELAVELLSDMVTKSTFTQQNIDVERKVILEEINMCEDDPDDYIHDILSETMWEGEPLGFPIAGTARSLEGIDRKTLLYYFQSNYTAENMVISIVGNIEEERLSELLEKYFGRIEMRGVLREKPVKIDMRSNIALVKKDIEQCQLCMGFDGYSRFESEDYDLSVVNALFGGNMSSRLFQKVREEAGLAYSVYSYTSAYQSNGSLTIYAGLNTEELYRALEIISKEIRLLKKDKLSREEVETAKTQLKATVVMGSEGISPRMSTYGKSLMFENRVKSIEEIIAAVETVSVDRVAEVIDRVFDINRMAVAVLGRIDDDKKKIMDVLDF